MKSPYETGFRNLAEVGDVSHNVGINIGSGVQHVAVPVNTDRQRNAVTLGCINYKPLSLNNSALIRISISSARLIFISLRS
jgi:hypothetical protein